MALVENRKSKIPQKVNNESALNGEKFKVTNSSFNGNGSQQKYKPMISRRDAFVQNKFQMQKSVDELEELDKSDLINIIMELQNNKHENGRKNNLNNDVALFGKPTMGYLIHRSSIIGQKDLPRFFEAQSVLPVYSWEETPKYIFISHRYLSIHHVDDKFHTKQITVELILRQMRQIEYVWIDFCCIPPNDMHRLGACMNLHQIITHALRVFIIPFRSITTSKPPVFDLKEYSRRAWCALEYSSILVHHPSKVRIVQLVEADLGWSFKIQFISLPTHDKTIGIDHLLSGMYALRDLLLADNKNKFLNTYRVTKNSDGEIVWKILKAHQEEMFGGKGVRRMSDFFVRTKFASNISGQFIEIYDQQTIAEMNQGPMNGPLNCLFYRCASKVL